MTRRVRLTLWLTVISGSLLVGSQTASAKTAFVERRGDRVHVTYQYRDSYRLKAAVPRGHKDYPVRYVHHKHFHYFPNDTWYGIPGNVFPSWHANYYPVYFFR